MRKILVALLVAAAASAAAANPPPQPQPQRARDVAGKAPTAPPPGSTDTGPRCQTQAVNECRSRCDTRQFEVPTPAEVNRTRAGLNYGWPYREGNACWLPATGCPSAGLTAPAYTYSHSEGCSVIGGVVYRGSVIPGRKGTYLFGDFCRNTFRSLTRTSSGSVGDVTVWAPPIPADNVAGFGEDAAGEVYIAMASGRVYQVVAVE